MSEHEKRQEKREGKDHKDPRPAGEGKGDGDTGTPHPEPEVRWPNTP
jgi:hypothetical protein